MNEEAPESTRSAERALLYALIAIVALTPLPLASNRPVPAALLALASGGLLCLWGFMAATRRIAVAMPAARLRAPLALFGLTSIWIFVQWLPVLPLAWADPIWTEASAALGTPLAGRLSVNPEATLTGLMHLLSYGAIFWLALQLTRPSEHTRLAITSVTFIGAAYTLYGLIVYVTGNEWLLIYRKWAYTNALSSTFVNRNSFATFAGLCLLCATALFINSFRHLMIIDRPARQRAVLIAGTIFGAAGMWRLATVFLLMIALTLTGSRAGIASSIVGLLVLLLTYLRGAALRIWHVLFVTALIGGAMVIALAIGGDLLAERLTRADAELAGSSRSTVYTTTIGAIKTAPWTGTGYGTYRDAFAAYRPEALSSIFFWDKAHNTYLENALELGVPAALTLNLAILLLALDALRGLWRRRKDRTGPALGVAATALVAAHSFFDFSLQIPAVALLYAFMLGFAVSQSWPHTNRLAANQVASADGRRRPAS
ncbi:O-antigen ligase family protein [Hoeflea sp.]|uniref:O-antigen ligase family protein n=1 Tax=Hoeflea sp. TaxID=1940281 RepID=UPI0019858454|nr:O-antigen ligase family protein [Hoeflea sp.]MBC7286242.1 O-antigen ligase family protein [Hoeflea sp.]